MARMIDGWTIVENPETDMPSEEESAGAFYTVILKGGRTKTAFWDKRFWDGMNGAQSLMYPYQTLAYKPIQIPDEIVQAVLGNKASAQSRFAEKYGH